MGAGGEALDPPAKHHGQPRRQWHGIRQRRPAGELILGKGTGQFEQRQRVALRLGNQPRAHRRRRLRCMVIHQPYGDLLREASHDQLGDAVCLESPRLALPRREQNRHRLGPKSPRGEHKRVRGGLIQPMGVVDDADQGLAIGGRRDEPQHRSGYQETVGLDRRRQAKRTFQRCRLSRRQLAHRVKNRPQQPKQARERQIRLRLNARHLQNRRRASLRQREIEECRLPDTRLAPDHQRGALPAPRLRQQPLNRRTLKRSAKEIADQAGREGLVHGSDRKANRSDGRLGG